MLGEYTVKDNVRVVLSAGITSAATSITVINATGMFHTPPDPTGDSASNGFAVATLFDSLLNPTVTEIITYKSVTNNGDGTSTLGTVARAQFGTTASAFSSGAYLIQTHTAAQNAHGSVTYNKTTSTLSAPNATLSGTLAVTGASTLAAVSATTIAASSNATVGGTLGVTGTTTAAQVNATGLGLSGPGNATIGGTLGVTGATTLGTTSTGQFTASTVHATGNTQLDGTLAVTGASTFAAVNAAAVTTSGQATVGNRAVISSGGAAPVVQNVNAITSDLQILDGTTAGAIIGGFSADGFGPHIQFEKSRSATVGTYSTTLAADQLGRFFFNGVNSANASTIAGGYFVVQVGAAGATNVAAQHQWRCGDNATVSGNTTQMNLTSTGLRIGDANSATAELDVVGQVSAKNFGTPSAAFTFTSNATTVDWTTTAHATITLPNTATTQTIHFTAPANPGTLRLKLTAPTTGNTPPIAFDATVKGIIPFFITLNTYAELVFEYDGTNYNYVGGCFSDGNFLGNPGQLNIATNINNSSTTQAVFNGGVTTTHEVTAGFHGLNHSNVTQSGSAATVDFSQGQNDVLLISSASCTLSFSVPSGLSGGFLALRLLAPASGTSPTLTWPASVIGGPSTTALGLGKKRTLLFYYDGSKYLYFNSSGDY